MRKSHSKTTAKFSNTLDAKLKIAWQLRKEQKISELMSLLSEPEMSLSGHVQVQCLRASLLRAQGRIEESMELLKKLREAESSRNTMVDNGVSMDPHMFMEEGLNCSYQGDSFRAVEKFLACYSLIKDTPQAFELAQQALINAMICFDNLGNSYEKTKQDLASLCQKNPLPQFYEWTLTTMHTYRQFREGFIGELNQMWAQSPSEGQAFLLELYLRSLPYTSNYNPSIVVHGLESFLLKDQKVFLKSYRLRTLHGIQHGEDGEIKKISEVIDRLYLWVWRWLKEPNEELWARIACLMDQFCEIQRTHLSVDDSEKLLCAYGWIGLVDPVFERQIQSFLKSLNLSTAPESHRIHQLEKQVIQYLRARRDGERVLSGDYEKMIRQHPLFDNPDIFFRLFLDEDKGSGENQFHDLASRILEMVEPKSSLVSQKIAKGKGPVIVNLRQWKITENSRTVHSESLCRALHLFYRRGNVSDIEFMTEVFGIPDFDPVIHNPKVFTLLWRLKKIVGGNSEFKVKQGRIFCRNLSKQLVFIEESVMTKIVRQKWPKFMVVSVNSELIPKRPRGEIAILLEQKGPLKRIDIEQKLGKSRPACNRLIDKWKREGLLEVIGRGPQTSYRLKKHSGVT